DVQGRCVDMPNVPPEHDFKDKVRAKAYPTAERNGLVWVYMGDRPSPPELPRIEATLLSPQDRVCAFVQRECNWMQALEGDIDTSHFGFLHVGSVDLADVPQEHPIYHAVRDRAPRYHVADMPWGTQYAAYRPVDGDATYWRTASFMFPFWTMQPQGAFDTHINARAWVPMDDEHTMFIHLQWQPSTSGRVPLKGGRPLAGARPDHAYLPPDPGWTGRWRLVANASNDWLIDREAQRTNRIYSGIDNIHLQDQAVTESMGPITDHALEHLGPADLMIARTRRRVLRAARDFRQGVAPAPGVDDPSIYWGARSGFFTAAGDERDWPQRYRDALATATRLAEPAARSRD
ncbi:MAG: (2Fe-2S)-binding protein, partial [Lautropia sp.]